MIQKIKNLVLFNSNDEKKNIYKETTRQRYAEMAVIYGIKKRHEKTPKHVSFTNSINHINFNNFNNNVGFNSSTYHVNTNNSGNQKIKYASIYSIYGLGAPKNGFIGKEKQANFLAGKELDPNKPSVKHEFFHNYELSNRILHIKLSEGEEFVSDAKSDESPLLKDLIITEFETYKTQYCQN